MLWGPEGWARRVIMQFWLNLGFVTEVEQLPDLAVAAELIGFDGVAIPHQIIIPNNIKTKYPYTPNSKIF